MLYTTAAYFLLSRAKQVYEGQVVGEHCKDNDIPVNVAKAKQLTNMRAAGKDDAAQVQTCEKNEP